MQTDTLLAGNLRAAEARIACDAAAKRILANREILAWILRGVTEEFKDCSIRDIADKYIESEPEISTAAVDADAVQPSRAESVIGIGTEDKTIGEGTVYYDIRFTATAPADGKPIKLIINVEAQNAYRPGYPLIKRAMYYCARMLSAQNGTEFVVPHYEDIKKVYSIWICSQPPQARQRAITRYHVAEEAVLGQSRNPKEHYDLLSIVFINLNNRFDEASGEMIDLLNTALTGMLPAEEKIKVLHDSYGITTTRELEGDVSLMCNISDGFFFRGMEEGMEKGMEEGMEKGILLSIRNLMESVHFSAEQAMNALRIADEDKPKYLKMLEQ